MSAPMSCGTLQQIHSISESLLKVSNEKADNQCDVAYFWTGTGRMQGAFRRASVDRMCVWIVVVRSERRNLYCENCPTVSLRKKVLR